MKITLSVIKADTGSVGGHNRPSNAMLQKAQDVLRDAVNKSLLTDGRVTFTGDDIALLMVHTKGVNHPDIHQFAGDTLVMARQRWPGGRPSRR